MKLVQIPVVCLLLGSIPVLAQKWEYGGGAGFGFYTSHDITSPGGTANAKINSNLAASAWLGNHNGEKWGGELRYNFQRGDLRLKQNSTEATFGAQAHSMHYDFLYHFSSQEASVRPFVAFGGGIKIYQGTGQEQLVQPLSRVALLTKAQDLVPMVSVGAGFKVQLKENVQLRVDVHDFLTPFPKEVIVPNGGSISAWINDIVPMVGLSFTK
jgi:hypothetical protein